MPAVSQVGYSRSFRRRARMASAVPSKRPTVTGTLTQGSLLTASPGSWAPTGSTISYQWMRGVDAIAGATASTYTLTSADMSKKRLACRLTARGSSGELNYDVIVNI